MRREIGDGDGRAILGLDDRLDDGGVFQIALARLALACKLDGKSAVATHKCVEDGFAVKARQA